MSQYSSFAPLKHKKDNPILSVSLSMVKSISIHRVNKMLNEKMVVNPIYLHKKGKFDQNIPCLLFWQAFIHFQL